MSGCDNSNIRKNYIVSGVEIDILSACTGFYTDNIYNCSGDTLTLHSDIVSANTINTSVYLSGGTNLLDIFATLVDSNTFVTGFTYDNSNNLSIVRNDNISIGVNISQFSGLTINGGLSATTLSACTGIYTSNLYGCSPINVNDNLVILSGITLSSITNNDLLTQILVRNSFNGSVEYRDVNTIITPSSANTFVTGFTYDNINTFTISDNIGNTFNSTINVLSATTISATTFYGDGSNLSGISTDNFYVSGGTYNVGLQRIDFSGNNIVTTFDVDLTSLVNSVTGDTFVTGTTFNDNQLTVTRNDGFDILKFSGGTNVNLSNPNTNQIKIDVVIPPDANTFVTGGTYNESNDTITLSRNDDVTIEITGITDTYTTGGTYNSMTDTITITNSSGGTYSITGISDTFVTGQTFNNSTYQLTTTLNDASNLVTDLSILSSDMVVTGGTYDINTGIVTFTNNSGGTFNVSGFTSGMTDSFTTTATTSGTEIQFNSNLYGSNFYNVDLTPIISAKTDVTLFNSHTADTSNPHQTAFSALTTTAHTHTLSEITDFNSYSGSVDTILNTKVEAGFNVGDGEGIFRDKTGTTLNFRSIKSTGSTVVVSTVGDVINLEVTQIPDTNTFVTGGTYSNGTLTLDRQNGSVITSGFFTGFTISDSVNTQIISNGDNLLVSAGSGLTTTVSATDNITIDYELSGMTTELSPTTGDKLLLFDVTSGLHKNIDWSQLPGAGGGEVNTASNVGGANGIFYQKLGADLQFRSIVAGSNITITSGVTTLTINSTSSGGGRITGSTQTTGITSTELEKIDTLQDNTTNIIEVYIKAYQSGGSQWGVWKRTLTVTKTSGSVTIQEVNADVDKTSIGLKANDVSFNVNGGDIDVDVTGIAATTIDWESAYEIIL